MFGKMGLHVTKYPSGRYGFVGSVPAALAFIYEDERDLKSAIIAGPGIAKQIAEREGRRFERRTFETEGAARDAAAALGFAVSA